MEKDPVGYDVFNFNFLEVTSSVQHLFKQSCPKHPEELTQFVCLDDQALFCSECLLDDLHSSHKKMKLDKYLYQVSEKSEAVKNELKALESSSKG